MTQPARPADTKAAAAGGRGADGGHVPATAPLDELFPAAVSNPPTVTSSEPTTPVSAGFLTVYALAYTALWMALLAPVIVTLSLRVQALVGPDDSAGSLALVSGVGALLALVGNPLVGRLSDRTTSRWGMRRPWLVGGAVGGLLALLIVAQAPNIPVLLLGWCLAQLSYNAVLAAIVAILPDQVPAGQRGKVSGIVGIGLPLGTVLGTLIVQAVAGNLLLMFVLPAAITLIAVVALVVVLKDRRLDPAQRPPLSAVEFARSFWVNPRRQPDFGWAWLSRFLLFLGLATLLTYQAFYLMDHLGQDPADLPRLIFLSTAIQAAGIVISSVIAGRLSDRIGRRKVFVFAAALIYAVGLAVIAFAGSYSTFLVGMAITGLGQGAYLAVDLALVTDVLPNREQDAAKDLGVFNIANAMPQSLAPAIAPLFLAIGGPNNYVALFVAAAVFTAVGALAISPVKGAR